MNVFAECLTDCAINACSVTHLHSHQNVGLYLLFVQVRDVVFVHNNLRLADKLVDINYSEKSRQWAETDCDCD